MSDKESSLRKVSFVAHGAQGAFIFVAFILLLVIKAQKGNAPSQIDFMFAMCFLSAPAIIFSAMSPRFDRTRRFANPIVLLVIGAFCTLFWFAAFIAIAIVNGNGIRAGEAKPKDPKKNLSGCAATTIGSPRICELSKGAIGVGLIVFLLFAVSTGISGYIVHYLQKNHLPWDYFQTKATPSKVVATDMEAATQEAFSHKMDMGPEDDASDQAGNYALLSGHGAPAPGGGNGGGSDAGTVNQRPYQRYDYEEHEQDLAYGGGGGTVQQQPYRPGSTTQQQQQQHHNPNEPVNFPQGPY